MLIWICDKCGCEVKENKPVSCPLCKRGDAEFFKEDTPNPSKEDEKYSKKFEEVIEKLDEYTEDCDPETLVYSVED